MEIDKTTLEDLAIFNKEEEYSVFHQLNFTRTIGGKLILRKIFGQPLANIQSIQDTQDAVKFLMQHTDEWPETITNGTLMVMDKFFDTGSEPIPLARGSSNYLNNLYYRIINSGDYSLIRYSLSHFFTFLQGFDELLKTYYSADTPILIRNIFMRAESLLSRKVLQEMLQMKANERMPVSRVLYFGHHTKYRHKSTFEELMHLYHQLDAYYSMAVAMKQYQLSFPQMMENPYPVIEAKELYHILLEGAVSYNVTLNREANFLFLTGANMAGKSTFIKAIGIAAFLAHIGMGVPAEEMKLTFFDGLLSNIQVQDNIFLGESYFYNEIQRIKKTILKINNGRHWLILIDELFKGTNFQDAKNCSVIVIEGLLKMKNSLFVLSTHLYEIAESLQQHPNIRFKYFETTVRDEIPTYSYQLKDGISNDRLGFIILKREKVLDLLNEIK